MREFFDRGAACFATELTEQWVHGIEQTTEADVHQLQYLWSVCLAALLTSDGALRLCLLPYWQRLLLLLIPVL